MTATQTPAVHTPYPYMERVPNDPIGANNIRIKRKAYKESFSTKMVVYHSDVESDSSEDEPDMAQDITDGPTCWNAQTMRQRREEVETLIQRHSWLGLSMMETQARKLTLNNVTHVWDDKQQSKPLQLCILTIKSFPRLAPGEQRPEHQTPWPSIRRQRHRRFLPDQIVSYDGLR